MKSIRTTITATTLILLSSSPLYAESEVPLEGVKDLFDKGGFVMMIIVGLSVVGVAFALERLVSLRKSRLLPAKIKSGLEEAKNSGTPETLHQEIKAGTTPLARVLKAGLSRSNMGVAEMERSMEAQGELEAARLLRPVRPIATLAQVEPLLGLLGTILGMISTFNLLHTTSAAERVSKLAPGIGQALYTTAAGLAIAIPFVLIHHYLQGRVLRATEEWSVMGTDLVELVNRPVGAPKQDESPRQPEASAPQEEAASA